MVNWLKIHWPHAAAIVLVVVQFALPSMSAWMTAHPHTSFSTFLGIAIAAYNMTAPKDVNRLK